MTNPLGTTTSVAIVTPQIAALWLQSNRRNRPISDMTVTRYRQDMEAGLWQFTGEAIQFDEDGNLINGQHRLSALAAIEGVLELPFMVVRGLPREAQMVMDQGRKRSTGQQLQMLGIKDGTLVASGVRLFLEWETGFMFRDTKAGRLQITTARIEQWVASSEVVEGLSPLTSVIKDNDGIPSTAYAAAIFFHRKSPEDCARFFHLLAKGAGDESHPITVLDKKLGRIRRQGARVSRRDELAMFIQAWNAWRKGDRLSRFPSPRGGQWTPTTFPKVAA